MRNYIISAIDNTTGEIREFRATIHREMRNSKGELEYAYFTRKYVDIYGQHKDEIEIYPKFDLISIKTLTLNNDKYEYDIAMPDIYHIDSVYQRAF